MVCRSSNSGSCRRENITYQIECKDCNYIYIGETSRNAYTRGKEHLAACEKADPNSVLYEHSMNVHNDNSSERFGMFVTGTYESALSRQITEATKIFRTSKRRLLNRKSEWGHNRMIHTVVAIE